MSLTLLSLFATAFAQDVEPTPEAEVAPAPGAAPAPSTAPADLERARELYENGRTLFDEGAYPQAILAWEQAYALSKRSALLFNIASAAERMGEYQRALDALTTYRAFAKEEEKESLNRRMHALERKRDEAREAAAAEKAAAEQVAAGEAARDATPAPATPVVQARPVETTPVRKRGSGQRAVGGTLVGLGVAGIGTGIALGVLSSSRKNAGAEACLDTGLCLATARPDLDASRSLGLGADIAVGAGIVSAGLGAVLLFTAPSGTVSVGANSVNFRGRF